MANHVRVADNEFAVALYYSQSELNGIDIKRLFNCKNYSTVHNLKKAAWALMDSEGVTCSNKQYVNTECAYRAWGIDIKRMERTDLM